MSIGNVTPLTSLEISFYHVTYLEWNALIFLCSLGDAFLSLMEQTVILVNIKLTSHRKYHPKFVISPRRFPIIYSWRCCIEWTTGRSHLRLTVQFMKTLACSSSLMNLTGRVYVGFSIKILRTVMLYCIFCPVNSMHSYNLFCFVPFYIFRHEKKHPPLLETYCNFVMRAHIDDVKLLIYSSEVLPPDSQC